MPRRDDIEKILLIGSGPIVIGQAAEFDYSGTQACRALRGLGLRVVLVNSNPATIMTDPEVADALRAEFERVFTLKASLRGEAEAGVSPTGRRTTAQDEAKLRTLVASVEGASRFAIRLRLLSPAQVRALWAEAMAKGLYDGWDAGQSAYDQAAETDVGDAPISTSGAPPEVRRGDA